MSHDILRPALGENVVAAGLSTNYFDSGSGRPVVLLHGSGAGVSAYSNWGHVIPVLAQHFRVLAPDVSGFGFTERREDLRYDLDHWIAHVVGFLDALQIPRVDLIGNSFGGAVALALAASHPERVRRVVLMGAVGTEFAPRALPPALGAFAHDPSPDTMRRYLVHFTANPAALTEADVQLRYRTYTRDGYPDTYRRLFPRGKRFSALVTPDSDIASIAARTLIVHGRDDEIVPIDTSLTFHRLIKDAELHIFARCGHWSHVDKAELFNRLVIDFLQD